MSDPRPGNFAHLPFLPAGLPLPYTLGQPDSPINKSSFFQGRTEESFMKYVWRVKSWEITTGSPVWFYDGFGGDHIVLDTSEKLPGTGPYIMEMGFHPLQVTGAYIDLDDILCRFRWSQSQFLGPLIYTAYKARLTVSIEPVGDYTGNDLFNILSSSLIVDDSDALDIPNYLTSTGGLDQNTAIPGVYLHFDPDGDNIITRMVGTDLTLNGYPNSSWSGGPIYVKPYEYWTWGGILDAATGKYIGGRFDSTTGEVVGDNVTQYMCQN